MIRHKTIGKNITMRHDFLSYFFQKVHVVIISEENRLFIVSSVVDVIHTTVPELHENNLGIKAIDHVISVTEYFSGILSFNGQTAPRFAREAFRPYSRCAQTLSNLFK